MRREKVAERLFLQSLEILVELGPPVSESFESFALVCSRPVLAILSCSAPASPIAPSGVAHFRLELVEFREQLVFELDVGVNDLDFESLQRLVDESLVALQCRNRRPVAPICRTGLVVTDVVFPPTAVAVCKPQEILKPSPCIVGLAVDSVANYFGRGNSRAWLQLRTGIRKERTEDLDIVQPGVAPGDRCTGLLVDERVLQRALLPSDGNPLCRRDEIEQCLRQRPPEDVLVYSFRGTGCGSARMSSLGRSKQ